MAQAARDHAVDLDRLSFTGTMDALRHFATAIAQAKTAKNRREIWDVSGAVQALAELRIAVRSTSILGDFSGS